MGAPSLHSQVPTAKSVRGVVICEQPELVAQFVRVLRPETAGMNIQELQRPVLLNFPWQYKNETV